MRLHRSSFLDPGLNCAAALSL